MSNLKPNASSLGVPFNQQPAQGSIGSQSIAPPVIVRPTASRLQASGPVLLSKGANQANPQFLQVARWDSGDPNTARPVRITITGNLLGTVLATGAGADMAQLAFVQWGSQSGSTQQAYVPVPCDFGVCATFVNVRAAIVERPVQIPPRQFGVDSPAAVQQQCVCSISEGETEGLPYTMIGSQGAITGSTPGYSFISPINTSPAALQNNVIVSEWVVTNVGANGTWVGLLDRAANWTPDGATLPVNDTFFDFTAPIWVPSKSTMSQSYDRGRAFFLGVACCCTQTPWSNAGFDAVNGPNLIVEVRGVIFPSTYGG